MAGRYHTSLPALWLRLTLDELIRPQVFTSLTQAHQRTSPAPNLHIFAAVGMGHQERYLSAYYLGFGYVTIGTRAVLLVLRVHTPVLGRFVCVV